METRQQAGIEREFGGISSFGRGAEGPSRGGLESEDRPNSLDGANSREVRGGDEHLWAWWRLTHRIRLGRFSTGANRDEPLRREIS